VTNVAATAAACHAETTTAPTANLAINKTEEQLKKMSNDALRHLCKERKLSTNGNKTKLVATLLANPNGRAPPIIRSTGTRDKNKEDAPLTGFHPDAKWRQLTHSIVPVQEPVGRPRNLVGPTAYKENEQEFKKFNFDEEFDRPPFTVTSQEYEVDNKGNIHRDRKGEPKWAKPIIEQGRANPAWLEKNKLTSKSHPADWFSALLPDKRSPENPNHIVSIADWTTFTNCKAWLANAGQGGLIYQDFKEFSAKEVKQFLALYILQGLSPSPQINEV